MQLRRFTADSTPAALGAVRLALGDDAIILANRRLGDQVEIIATGQMDDVFSMAEISSSVEQMTVGSGDTNKAIASAGSIASTGSSVADACNDTVVGIRRNEVVASPESANTSLPAAGSLSTPLTGPQGYSMSSDFLINASQVPYDVESVFIEQAGAGSSQSIDQADAVAAPSITQSSVELDETSQARLIESLKESMADLLADTLASTLDSAMDAQSELMEKHFKSLEVNLWGSNSPNHGIHLQRLFAMGVGADLAIRLVERCAPELDADEALRQSFALLKSTLPIGNDKTLSVPGVTIMSGPPGAGKTTALIKLATEHVRQFGTQSIVIICADTRRIGAFEELQAYGRLLGVPTVHAHDGAELDSLIDAFTHKQLVLVDHTLPKAESAIEIPKQLREPKDNDVVRHLFVLPATIQASTADTLIAEHCHTGKMHCVLTHLDASAKLGELFNAIIRHHLPVAYWSDSASVQQPLQKADGSVLIATAVAMSRRIRPSPDDQWLQRLIQPSRQVFQEAIVNTVEAAR